MMGMNKKECRKFVDLEPRFNLGSGIFLIDKIKYIARSAVKIIAGRRTLVINFYNREKAASGCNEPTYTLFQCKDDYITLHRGEHDTEIWRGASLAYLEKHGIFTEACAFYHQCDEQVVTKFCGISDNTGFCALNTLQATIMSNRLATKKLARERKTIKRMASVISGQPPRKTSGESNRNIAKKASCSPLLR